MRKQMFFFLKKNSVRKPFKLVIMFNKIFFYSHGYSGQFAGTLINPTSPEVNDHVNLQ